MTGTTTWTHTFPALPRCAHSVANNAAGPTLAQTGPGVPAGPAGLLAVLLALIGAGLLYAGRRSPVRRGTR